MDLLKNFFYTSVGFAVKSKEGIEELAQKFVKENEMSAEEGRRFIDEMLKKSDEAKEDFSKAVDSRVKESLDKVGLATKKEVDELKTKLDELKEELNKKQNAE